MSTHSTDASVSSTDMVLRQTDYWRTRYARTWKGSIISTFLEPVLYLMAMGVLLGQYVDDAGSSSIGPSYLDFVAPGLMAAAAMQLATSETTWPVMGAVKWDKTYYAMLATPLRVRDIVTGHLSTVVLRLVVTSTVFALVVALFGVFVSPLAAAGAVAAASLTGVAFAFVVYAWSAGAENEQSFALIYRIGVIPMFLFSGAFFPISNLAEPLEWVARVLPLWHGVELARGAAQGTLELLPAAGHALYLVVLAALGAWLAVRRLTRRLVV
jgi:lipooligosaccharide transport system permease protein